MTARAPSERPSPVARLLPRSWETEAHRLLVLPAEELTAPELDAAGRLARAVGTCASEFVREGGDGANPHGIEPVTAAAAYVRFVVAVLYDFGPAASWELERWKRQLESDDSVNDPRVEAFRSGYDRPPGEAPSSEGAREVRPVPSATSRRSHASL